MIGTYLNSSCQTYDIEYTLLTKDKVEEISDRISQNIEKEIYKQLENSISSLSCENKSKRMKSNENDTKKPE